jgi:hypothetical protein
MEVNIEPEYLFSLEDCSNLSELTLDMEHSASCHPIRDSISILSTLDLARSSGLGKIVLDTYYVDSWFNEDGKVDDEGDWEGLDAVLSGLAKAAIRKGEEKLTFTLVVMKWDDDEKLMPMVRKWLPKLLPRFNELGLLHIHYGRGGRCRGVNGRCLPQDELYDPDEESRWLGGQLGLEIT